MSRKLTDLPLADRLSIEDLCDEFETALSAEKNPRIEEWLDHSSHADLLFSELLRLEIDWRQRHGEAASPEDYVARFPDYQAALERVMQPLEVTTAPPNPLPTTATPQKPPAPASQARSDPPARPETRTDFEATWRGSNIHTDEEVSAYLDRLPKSLHDAAAIEVARYAAKQKWLTRYQAKSILTGKTKALALGNYVILDRVGQGGMGQVFRAKHTRMGRIVALKVLTGTGMRSHDAMQRFRKEIYAAGRLSHPNIVTAFDADETETLQFLVMEYVQGRDLKSVVNDSSQLSVAQAVDYLLQTARGLEFAHANGIYHRDIKPANLLISNDGVVKVLDMGLAEIVNDLEESHGLGDLTQSGQVMGTPEYMSPEQGLDTSDIDGRTDIYSLGCTLHFLLTGKPPYPASTLMARLLAHREQPIPSLRAMRADVPKSLDTLFRGMLAKDVESRIPSMTEVVRRLTLIQRELNSAGSVVEPISPIASDSGEQPWESDDTIAVIPQIDITVNHSAATITKPKMSGLKMAAATASGIGLLVLLVLGLTWMTPPAQGRLALEVSQAGSTLFVTNEAGETIIGPLDIGEEKELDVPAGRLQLLVSKPGFLDFKESVSLESGTLVPIAVNLQPKEPPVKEPVSGTLKLVSEIPGIEVQVRSMDDETVVLDFLSQGAPEVSQLPPGQYRIQGHKAGFADYSGEVRILENAELRHEIHLEELVAAVSEPPPTTPETSVGEGPDIAMPPSDPSVSMPENPSPTPNESTTPNGSTTPENSPAHPVWTGWPEGQPDPLIAPFTREDAEKAQREWAKHLGFGSRKDNYLIQNQFGMTFVLIPPGEFTMGAPMEEVESLAARGGWNLESADPQSPRPFGPQRRVIISQPFFLSATELTVRQRIQMNAFRTKQVPTPPASLQLENPVNLSPFDAVEIIRDLGVVEGFAGRYLVQRDAARVTIPEHEKPPYRLPTMAEWEYAARAGTTGAHWMLELEPTDRRARITSPEEKLLLSEVIYENSKVQRPVKQGKPNPFGLYDIIGNQREYCEDGEILNYFDRDIPEPWVDPVVPLRKHLAAKGAMHSTEAAMVHVSTYVFGVWVHPYGHTVRPVLDVDAALDLRERKALRVGVGP